MLPDDYSEKLTLESQNVETLFSHLRNHVHYAQVQLELLEKKLKITGAIAEHVRFK
jgi:hypothetical protein